MTRLRHIVAALLVVGCVATAAHSQGVGPNPSPGGPPTGAAGGVLNGTYPNPGFASTTGSGANVLATSPTLVTPVLGAATATSVTVSPIIGGTTTTSPLTLRSTSGVGITGADIVFQTGNNGATEAMRILNGGNVGIGTISPINLLDIRFPSVINGNNGLSITNDRGSGALDVVGYRMKSDGGGVSRAAITVKPNATSEVEALTVLLNGNVGIGTLSPGSLLDVNGTVNVSSTLTLNAQMFVPNITTSSSAQNGTVCWTTGTGKFTVDTTVGCLTSIGAAKTVLSKPTPTDALNIVNQLEPVSFKYKDGFGDGGHYEQFGLIAEQVASVDERLAGRDPEGTLRGVRYQELTAVLIGAIQKLKADNDNLRARLDAAQIK